jgi:hypothetical protein
MGTYSYTPLEYADSFRLLHIDTSNDHELGCKVEQVRLKTKERPKYSAIAQPKLTDLDSPLWLAPMPLYVSQLRTRLNFGSPSIRLHRHGSGCSPEQLSLSTPPSAG